MSWHEEEANVVVVVVVTIVDDGSTTVRKNEAIRNRRSILFHPVRIVTPSRVSESTKGERRKERERKTINVVDSNERPDRPSIDRTRNTGPENASDAVRSTSTPPFSCPTCAAVAVDGGAPPTYHNTHATRSSTHAKTDARATRPDRWAVRSAKRDATTRAPSANRRDKHARTFRSFGRSEISERVRFVGTIQGTLGIEYRRL